MGRLSDELLETTGCIDAYLEFERDEEKRPVLKGGFNGSLVLECQRCLKPLEWPVKGQFQLVFIRAGAILESESEAEDSPGSGHIDLYEVENEQVCLASVIEDEMLLLLPQVPMHSAPACVIKTEFGDDLTGNIDEEKENPFAVLASLKEKLKTD
jgi:uncharacterized protein